MRVVEPLVVRHVTERVGRNRLGRTPTRTRPTRTDVGRRQVGAPLVCRHPRHERRFGRGVVVLGEGDPGRPPRVVEAQRAAFELSGRRAGRSAFRPTRPRHRPPRRPVHLPLPLPDLATPPPLAAPGATPPTPAPDARSSAPTPRAAQHRCSADATSAKGSTKSNDNSPDARPSAKQGRDSKLAAERTHCFAVDVLTPHCPVTHATIETEPSPRHASARSNSAMSISCSRCSVEICPDRWTIRAASSCDRASPPKFAAGRPAQRPIPPCSRRRTNGHHAGTVGVSPRRTRQLHLAAGKLHHREPGPGAQPLGVLDVYGHRLLEAVEHDGDGCPDAAQRIHGEPHRVDRAQSGVGHQHHEVGVERAAERETVPVGGQRRAHAAGGLDETHVDGAVAEVVRPAQLVRPGRRS